MSSITSTGSSLLSNILSSGALPNVGTTATNSNSTSLAIAGVASGMNWQTVVQQLGQAEAAPETQWEAQQTTLNAQNSAYSTIFSDLTALQTDVQNLQDPSLYENASALSSNSSIATGTAATGAALGTYTFNISQLATA
ncbi:MAG TPA: flagellar cap protein FliD N-terminal domain-containing protein, partial [Pseudomonadales bacterium]|nr:flagellar cap protein FliD N-terminal domain-containing protein [Pseudomonadales bacterium]